MKKRLCILLFAVVFLTLSAVAENCHRHITAAEGDMTFSANMKKVQWTFDSEAENMKKVQWTFDSEAENKKKVQWTFDSEAENKEKLQSSFVNAVENGSLITRWSPRAAGWFFRIGGGVPANINAGIGYRFAPQFSLTAELKTYSGLTSIVGGIDARFYFTKKNLTPFIALNADYGCLGKTLDYRDYWADSYSFMLGLSWRRFDLGLGVSYDTFSHLLPLVNLSYNIRL